jgi:hypothetical protein
MNCVGRGVGLAVGAWGLAVGAWGLAVARGAWPWARGAWPWAWGLAWRGRVGLGRGAWPWRVGLGLAVGPAAIGCDFTAKEISWQAMGPHHRR